MGRKNIQFAYVFEDSVYPHLGWQCLILRGHTLKLHCYIFRWFLFGIPSYKMINHNKDLNSVVLFNIKKKTQLSMTLSALKNDYEWTRIYLTTLDQRNPFQAVLH